MTLDLGTKVTYTHTLSRVHQSESFRPPGMRTGPLYSKSVRRWKAFKGYGEPRHGVVVGIRTLSDGYVEYHYEEGTEFIPVGKYTRAYIVFFSMVEKPVYVLPEHLQETTDTLSATV